MTFEELVSAIKEKGVTEATKKDIKAIIEAMFEVVKETVVDKKEEVRLSKYGKFMPHVSTKTVARNPRTGETMSVKPKTKVKFKPFNTMIGE